MSDPGWLLAEWLARDVAKFKDGCSDNGIPDLREMSNLLGAGILPPFGKPNGDTRMSSEQEIEAEIQRKGLNAPRLTPDDIDAVIASESYTVLPSGRTTICELTLRNGFTVTGESSCVSIDNFDAEIGRKIARDDARDKVWQLEAYLLRDRLFQAVQAAGK